MRKSILRGCEIYRIHFLVCDLISTLKTRIAEFVCEGEIYALYFRTFDLIFRRGCKMSSALSLLPSGTRDICFCVTLIGRDLCVAYCLISNPRQTKRTQPVVGRQSTGGPHGAGNVFY